MLRSYQETPSSPLLHGHLDDADTSLSNVLAGQMREKCHSKKGKALEPINFESNEASEGNNSQHSPAVRTQLKHRPGLRASNLTGVDRICTYVELSARATLCTYCIARWWVGDTCGRLTGSLVPQQRGRQQMGSRHAILTHLMPCDVHLVLSLRQRRD